MNSHPNTEFSRAPDFLGHLLSPDAPLPLMRFSSEYHLMAAEQMALNEPDWVNENHPQFSRNSCSSGGSSYGSPSSLASYGAQRPSFMQRSISSHSLQKNGAHQPISVLFTESLGFENSPVRRVYSTGDLQRIKSHQTDSPLSSESSMIIEGMSRACPYSPAEKAARIERYRSKRNRRNFNKKIKYACRKTLADSRPRIRGRFARNEEIEKSSPAAAEWSQAGGEEEDQQHENWVNLFDNLIAANLNQQQPQDNSTFGLLF